MEGSAIPGDAYKAYVTVLTEIRADGLMLPRMITWEDGMKYEVDRVIDVRPGYAAKAGGQGDRYTIMVNGRRTYGFPSGIEQPDFPQCLRGEQQ